MKLLLDDGQHLRHLEGVRHEELGVGHVTELRLCALVLGTLDDQGELVGVLSDRLGGPLLALLY